MPSPEDVARERLRSSSRRRLLLDYDGTLTPIRTTPGEAVPDPELLLLLRALATPSCDVVIVSGRSREQLDAFFSAVPVSLSAEHGLWHRRADTTSWEARAPTAFSFAAAEELLVRTVKEHRGALLEKKTAGLAFHYRQAPLDDVALARLQDALAEAAGEDAVLIDGDAVLEIVPRGVSKALAVTEEAGVSFFACGDDTTDLAMLAALPDPSLAATVGERLPRHALHFATPTELRAFLRSLTASSSPDP